MSSSKTNISLVGKTVFYIVFKRYNIYGLTFLLHVPLTLGLVIPYFFLSVSPRLLRLETTVDIASVSTLCSHSTWIDTPRCRCPQEAEQDKQSQEMRKKC